MATVNLIGLFGQKVFRIPDYQRGYAWGERQLNELWDDIDEICVKDKEGQKHYTGTIFFEKMPPSHIDVKDQWLTGYEFYYVVDGQQRLTTIMILLFELLKVEQQGYGEVKKQKLYEQFIAQDNMTGSSSVHKFGYSNNEANLFMLSEIFEDNSVIQARKTVNSYTNNLLFAKRYFKGKISDLDDIERGTLFHKVTHALQFDERFINDDLDVQAVFETMNNRGKPLTALEKLKNRLIYLTDKLNRPQEDKLKLRQIINDAFGKIYSNLAKNPNNVLDEDEFLSAHLSLYRKPKDATFSERLAEKKVFEMFCNKSSNYPLSDGDEKEPPVDYAKIHDYVTKLSELVPFWYEVNNSKSQLINKLLLLNNSKEIKIFLTALELQKKSCEKLDIDKHLTDVEKILFRNRVPGLWLMDERNLANWAREVYLSDSDDISESLNSYTCEYLSKQIDNQSLIGGIRYLFSYVKGNKGFYRWGTLKYLLFEYENSLKKEYKETSDRISIVEDFAQTTIEHILPQAYETYWQKQIDDYLSNIDEAHHYQAKKILINTLGNLTLLKQGKNSSLGNKPWNGDDGKKKRFLTGSYNEYEVAQYEDWNKNSIENRGGKILKFLESKIDGLCLSEDDINNILFTEKLFFATKCNLSDKIQKDSHINTFMA